MNDYLTKRIAALNNGLAGLNRHIAQLEQTLDSARQKRLVTMGALEEAKDALAELSKSVPPTPPTDGPKET